MGVTGLWPILEPSARPTPLPTLSRKRLAVDASIWIYQFLKAVRDKEGNALPNSHIVGFFRRICKLLYFGIKPVFIFDGGAPVLKRQTIRSRKERREGRRDDAIRTAGKLLALQMKRREEEKEERRKLERELKAKGIGQENEEEVLDADETLVYVDEMHMSLEERNQNRKFRKTDAYHLPELPNSIEGMGQPNDPRVMGIEELEEYARQFNNGKDINLYDFSKIDFNGEFFKSLPAGDRYNILNAARLRSRLRMGLSKDQLEEMFPDRMAFSRFQIERVRERNELTQRLMNLNGMNDDLIGVSTGRIAGDSSREYVLVKNEGVEGGWALGVVRTDKGTVGERSNPIDVDIFSSPKSKNVDSEEEDEFEDVPVEGLNRLPKLKLDNDNDTGPQAQCVRYQTQKSSNLKINVSLEKPDSLFIEDNLATPSSNQRKIEKAEFYRAFPNSLQQICNFSESEDEYVQQAIMLSLQKAYDREPNDCSNIHPESIAITELDHKIAIPQKPINLTDGTSIAHNFNKRAGSTILKRKASDINCSSDDEVDLQTTLEQVRKQKASKECRIPTISVQKSSPNECIPFENLRSLFSISQSKKAQYDVHEAQNEDLEGGFEKECNNVKESKEIPPWLVGQSDIRSDIELQKKSDSELNAEDRKRATEDQNRILKDLGPVIIELSDDENNEGNIRKSDISLSSEKIEISSNVCCKVLSTLTQDYSDPVEAIITTSSEKTEVVPVEPDELETFRTGSGNDTILSQDNRSRATKSESQEFEEIQFPTPMKTDESSITNTYSSLDDEEAKIYSSKDRSFLIHPSSPTDKYVTEITSKSTEVYDYSDPDDEELFAQLAVEAQEHGRFASTLNNKSELENKQDYERELKALRSQQRKDRRDADEVSQTMISECQVLLRLLGIPYITAPMEAEAQCAELVRLGLVDGVVTDDCDIFLFGGTRVYKNMFNSNKYVECYLATDIEKELSLSREHLISIAYLLGSDYTEGLPGIGPVTALEIVSEFSSISEFACWWRSAQHSVDPETSAFRQKFHRKQAAKLFLPTDFPSPAVSEAYWKPEVDSCEEEFQWGVPNLEELRNFLMETIGWSRERTDEILVPVIRNMNRQEAEGIQSNITNYFQGNVGTGVRGLVGRNNVTLTRSKRMQDAVGKLKAKKQSSDGALSKTFADEAREWVLRERLGKNKGSEGHMVKQNERKRNRKIKK